MYPDHCIYRCGPTECERGHDVHELARPPSAEDIAWRDEHYPNAPIKDIGIFRRVPCIARNNVHTCPDFRLPTKEELAKYEAETDALVVKILEQVNIVRPAIMTIVEENAAEYKYFAGDMPCPICRVGRVEYAYHGHVNGHIQARCSTPACVEWIE